MAPALGDDAISKITQFVLVLSLLLCLEMAGAYKCSYSPPGFHDACSLQFRVDLGHSIGVDLKVYSHLPDRRQVVRRFSVSQWQSRTEWPA